MKKNFIWKVLIPSLITLSPFILFLIMKLFNKSFTEKVIILIADRLFGSISEDVINLLGNVLGLFICLVLSSIILRAFRKRNKEKIFNEEDGYFDYPYFVYFYVSKVLNYGTCSLINVPVEKQFRLVLNRTFGDFKQGDYTHIEDEVIEEMEFFDKTSFEVNLILSDTYPLDKQKLPSNKQELPTYKIQSRANPDNLRVYNEKFVNQARIIVSNLSQKYNRINVFSYANPRHNYEIINACFRTGKRSGFSEVYVYRAGEKPNYLFKKGFKIKNN